MGAAAPVISLASIGLSAMGSVAQGEATAAADQYQAQRLERAAQYGKVQATQTSAQGLENLNIRLDNIDAIRAAGGADPSSPTTAAIRSRTSYLGERSIQTQVGNILEQSDENTAGAAYLNSAGSFAQTMGAVGAGATLLKGIGQTNFGTFGFG